MSWRGGKVFARDFTSNGVHDKSTERVGVKNGYLGFDLGFVEGGDNKVSFKTNFLTSDEKIVDSCNSMESGKTSNKN